MAYKTAYPQFVEIILKLYRAKISPINIAYHCRVIARQANQFYCSGSPKAPCVATVIRICQENQKFTMKQIGAFSRPIDMGGDRDAWIEWTPETNRLEFESFIGHR